MAARKAIDSYIYETPLILSVSLSKRTGHHKILLKCENLQRTGSYHYRGFIHSVVRAKARDLSVTNFITYSVANGGRALACAAEDFQSAARVVAPGPTHPLVASGIRYHGGVLYPCGPTPHARDARLAELAQTFQANPRGRAVVVDPYHDPDLLAGFGTVGIELMLQTDCEVDCVVAPLGGGALINSLAVALRGMKPNVAVFGAISDFVNESDMSLRYVEMKTEGKEAEKPEAAPSSSNPSILERKVTKWNAKHMKKLVNGVLQVTEEDVRYAFRYVYERCKLVIDLKAATAVAAVLANPKELRRYQCVAVVLSGGNVDLKCIPDLMSSAL
ncbi:unnamed protein product [Phytomonas sp. Hart1]|nr:unnamed protein product [Phytomonas sp. Hart1]|eukprot:CCW71200.1 unnamed protein product [Phytomonas sp. isolate Hart1]